MSQKIARRKIAHYIAQQLVDGKTVDKIAASTVAYLIDTKQTKQLDLLIRDVEQALVAHGTVTASVVSAHELDDATRSLIAAFIAKAEHAESVVITEESVDPDVIGGVIIRSPDRVFDGSVRNQLKQLTTLPKEV